MLIFIIISSIIIVCIAGWFLYVAVNRLTQKKYDEFLLQNSICLQKLKEINSRYKFYECKKLVQKHTYDNENFYDDISCEDYLIYQLQFIRKQVYDEIKKTNSNKQQYSKYLDEINKITDFGTYKAPVNRLKPEKLIKREKLLLNKYAYGAPATQFVLTVMLSCSTINGRVYGRKFYDFSAEEVLTLINRLNRKSGTFYNDRGIWDALCRVERGKVSNKMRFSIYDRDGYRCRICGATERYAQLEIDHIIPIAKGGKSTYNNLQTLCHRCNVNKGDSLY